MDAAGTKNDSKGDQPAAPASALDLLEKVWSTYTEDEKFPASGGDYSEANSKEDAPGVYDLTDRAAVDSALGLPETAKVDQAASLVHMMNQNTFTAAAYHCTDDADALATALRDNIQQRQWMCGWMLSRRAVASGTTSSSGSGCAASPIRLPWPWWASMWCPCSVPRIL